MGSGMCRVVGKCVHEGCVGQNLRLKVGSATGGGGSSVACQIRNSTYGANINRVGTFLGLLGTSEISIGSMIVHVRLKWRVQGGANIC